MNRARQAAVSLAATLVISGSFACRSSESPTAPPEPTALDFAADSAAQADVTPRALSGAAGTIVTDTFVLEDEARVVVTKLEDCHDAQNELQLVFTNPVSETHTWPLPAARHWSTLASRWSQVKRPTS